MQIAPGTSLPGWAGFVPVHAEAWTVTLDRQTGAGKEATAIDSSLASAYSLLRDIAP